MVKAGRRFEVPGSHRTSGSGRAAARHRHSAASQALHTQEHTAISPENTVRRAAVQSREGPHYWHVARMFLPERKGSSVDSAGGEQPATASTNGCAGNGGGRHGHVAAGHFEPLAIGLEFQRLRTSNKNITLKTLVFTREKD